MAYTSGITNLDPLPHNLIFERFLNPGRISMPDIDMDFPDDRRAEMINYAVNKYGKDKVAQIITFGTLGARAAIRDTGRALDIPLSDVDRMAKLVPNVPGKPVKLQRSDGADSRTQAGVRIHRTDVKSLIDTAITVEGTVRNIGTHAAGRGDFRSAVGGIHAAAPSDEERATTRSNRSRSSKWASLNRSGC